MLVDATATEDLEAPGQSFDVSVLACRLYFPGYSIRRYTTSSSRYRSVFCMDTLQREVEGEARMDGVLVLGQLSCEFCFVWWEGNRITHQRLQLF